MAKSKITNYLTIDVEDYFQVSAGFEKVIDPKSWDTYPSKVVSNTQIILDLLAKRNTKATFFIVGWIAYRKLNFVYNVHD